jgi:cardiolipin synthase A/B
MFIVGLLIVFQLLFLIIGIWKLTESFVYLYAILTFLSLFVVIYIVSTEDNPSYKLAWTIPVLSFPVFGGLFYLIFGLKKTTKRFRERILKIHNDTEYLLEQDGEILNEIKEKDTHFYNQVSYLNKYAASPIYKNTITKYLSPGEKFYKVLIEELKKARHYIFLEYFIIGEGKMWDAVLEILEEKVKEGLDIRLIYDDMGSLTTLPYKYHEKLKQKGIKTLVFNPFVPFLSVIMNNRDHRKITVIDGHTAFIGGINLADEYINERKRFGYWKDSSIMLKGDAVWKVTMMFLQVWKFTSGEEIEYEKYKPYINYTGDFGCDGYVLPYGDSPLDDEAVGESVYLNIINKAANYVYIVTPYLIVDNEIVTALTLAAKNGVDVRIITPHIPDKWYVHRVTRAYYAQLIKSGVKIYEYTPGFIHSKTFVSDDKVGVVGTINLDYRSLYLHFECGVLLYETKSVTGIKEDFLDSLSKAQEIKIEDCNKEKFTNRFITAILRVFAPLM